MEFLESASSSSLYASYAPQLQEIGALLQSKLWHQLACKLETLAALPEFSEQQRLLTLYEKVIDSISTHLNPFTVAQIAVKASKQCKSVTTTREFLIKVRAHLKDDFEANLLLGLEIASVELKDGNLKECNTALHEMQEKMNSSAKSFDTMIWSKFYLTKLELHRVKGSAAQFFRNALLYLSYTSLDDIPKNDQIALASDVSLAALVGEDIYNFGELLEHMIVKTLAGSQFDWLSKMLDSFNSGDIETFEGIYREEAPNQEILRNNNAFLMQKIRIMNLMEMVFNRASDNRVLKFKEIADECRITINEVELLVMKAMSLCVIKGSINQVEQCVHVKWVQARVLNTKQIETMRDRLTEWTEKLDQSIVFVQNEAPELLAK